MIQDATNGGVEPVKIDRFGQVVDEPGITTELQVRFAAEATHGDTGNSPVDAEVAHEFEPVAVRKFDIGDQQVKVDLDLVEHGTRREENLAGRGEAVSGHDVMTTVAEDGREEPERVLIVLDHQNAQSRITRVFDGVEAGVTRTSLAVTARFKVVTAGSSSRNVEPSPSPGLDAVSPPPSRLRERAADCQPQAETGGPTAKFVHALFERCEDPGQLLGVDPDPRVLEIDDQPMGKLICPAIAAARILDGVGRADA